MLYVNLTKGKRAKVCDCHYDLIKDIKWQYHPNGYAVSGIYVDGKHKVLRMHRMINNTPEGLDTDHIDRDKLHNECSNLRTATRSENNRNAKIRSDNTSGYKGITWDKINEKWAVQVSVDKKVKKVGRFLNISDAILARSQYE